MPTYVDGYLLPLPKKNLAAYRKLAALGAKVWKRHGALSYIESVLDDPSGQFCLPFGQVVKLKRGETLVLAFATFKSRAHRDRVNKKVMQDPELAACCDPKALPFDPKRMAYSGFSALVEG